MPQPPRDKRLLFDQFHSLNYPSNGFIWKDSLDEETLDSGDPYEWLGDHLYTNMQGLYSRLTKSGYFLEIASQPFTCIEATNYGALLLIDIEDYLSEDEIRSIRFNLETNGLSLIIVADWYN